MIVFRVGDGTVPLAIVIYIDGHCDLQYAQAPFSQNEPSGYPMLSLVIYVYHGISWDIPV